MHMEDNRVTITVQLIEWRLLLGGISHEGLLEQLSRYQQLYGDINPRFIRIAYGRAYRLVESASALMDGQNRLVLLSGAAVSHVVHGISTYDQV